jgi:hypothetical protein
LLLLMVIFKSLLSNPDSITFSENLLIIQLGTFDFVKTFLKTLTNSTLSLSFKGSILYIIYKAFSPCLITKYNLFGSAPQSSFP